MYIGACQLGPQQLKNMAVRKESSVACIAQPLSALAQMAEQSGVVGGSDADWAPLVEAGGADLLVGGGASHEPGARCMNSLPTYGLKLIQCRLDWWRFLVIAQELHESVKINI